MRHLTPIVAEARRSFTRRIESKHRQPKLFLIDNCFRSFVVLAKRAIGRLHMRSLAKKLTGFSLWAILGPALVFGQASFEAQVRGIVHDSSGGVVVGAKVTITDADTGISSNTTTNDRGLYIF